MEGATWCLSEVGKKICRNNYQIHSESRHEHRYTTMVYCYDFEWGLLGVWPYGG
jgi:hypothetical protein